MFLRSHRLSTLISPTCWLIFLQDHSRPLRSATMYRILWCSSGNHNFSTWMLNKLSTISVLLGKWRFRHWRYCYRIETSWRSHFQCPSICVFFYFSTLKLGNSEAQHNIQRRKKQRTGENNWELAKEFFQSPQAIHIFQQAWYGYMSTFRLHDLWIRIFTAKVCLNILICRHQVSGLVFT